MASRPDTASAHLPPTESVIAGLENENTSGKRRLASSEPMGTRISSDGRRVDYPGGDGYGVFGDSIHTKSGWRDIISTKQPDGSIKTVEKNGIGTEIKRLETDNMKTESVYQNNRITEDAVTDKKKRERQKGNSICRTRIGRSPACRSTPDALGQEMDTSTFKIPVGERAICARSISKKDVNIVSLLISCYHYR